MDASSRTGQIVIERSVSFRWLHSNLRLRERSLPRDEVAPWSVIL